MACAQWSDKKAKPDSRSVTAWVAVAKTKDPTITLVNCTGERRRRQGSDNQSAELHRCRRRDQGSVQLFIGMFHILLLMGLRHIPVCNIIEWLYVYACMCMIVCVWLYDKGAHDVMMTVIRPYTFSNSVSSNMIVSVSIHVGCLPKINKQFCYLQEWNGMNTSTPK